MSKGGLAPPPVEDELAAQNALTSGVIFVLENANLEVGKVGKTYHLLNSDDHGNFLRRMGKDPGNFRPDITHQALLAILDSPLNKAGRVKAVYIRTLKNVLIQVNPKVRLPRTFHRFCGLFVQLLQKLSIRATNGPDKLLKVIKGPVTKHLPAGARRIGFSSKASLQSMNDFAAGLPDDQVFVFVVGAFAHGRIDEVITDEQISISQYPLSAAYALGRITNSLESKWSII